MSAQIISGTALSASLRSAIASRAKALSAQAIKPGLAVILVGQNPASQVYVRSKVKACEEVGFHSQLEKYPEDLSEPALLTHIERLNQDPLVHGVLVQLPLPSHINANRVIEAINPSKDVDGFHLSSAGALLKGMPGFWPCTPYGCMKMLESINYELAGKHAVVLGRSHIVGKPMALMLLDKNATVTICHSRTQDLASITRQADVIVAAVGRQNMVTKDMVKPGAVVLDVGINRDPSGQLCGDVDFSGVSEVASYITPVPGGVGPMTITMLLSNTLDATLNITGAQISQA